jgi:hypothetical protein
VTSTPTLDRTTSAASADSAGKGAVEIAIPKLPEMAAEQVDLASAASA